MVLEFVTPSMDYIPSFTEALEEGTFTHMALGDFGVTTADEVRADPQAYIQILTNTSPRDVKTPNGESFTFHDHYILWVVDDTGRFLGGISCRYDDNALINEYCGHVGMSVRPALLYKGYGAKAALQLFDFIIQEAQNRDMTRLLASADPDNPASWRILEHVGGKLIKEHDPYGYGPAKLYELDLEDKNV